ncbi:glycosyltransferase family 2 protein [Rufibacter latericius]|uniref:glycosyltransferase family 2 protein n=1 Tax=Rufibacter latericius TaxID=2487040 RepID=UPI001403311D|nr:glycosyltransferase family 2 protein [Rufibacter latericius]
MSIIIPNYNRAKLIGQTLTSIISQSYSNWEAIVVDDGSNDGSALVVEEWSLSDSRIKLYKRTNYPKGAPSCRNLGLKHALGKYIIFLDSDDLLAPWCLESRVNYMHQNPDIDFAVFQVLLFKQVPGDLNLLWNKFNEVQDLFRFLRTDVPWQTTSPIWEAKSLLKVGEWDTAALSWQDWEFHIRALLLNLNYTKVANLPDAFIRRDGEARISSGNFTPERTIALKMLFEKIDDYIITFTNDNFLRKVLSSNFLVYAENIIVYKISIDYIDFIKPLNQRKIVSSFDFNIIIFYLKVLHFFNSKGLRKFSGAWYKFSRLYLPKYAIKDASTFSNTSISESEMNKLQKCLSKYNG